MMKTILKLILACSLAGALSAAELKWHTDKDKALAKAREEGRMVLADFTGSDWCGFCIKLDKEVFATEEFAEYAKKNLVLLKVDFPRRKELPAEQQAANNELRDQYKIRGYPTLVFLSKEGKEIDRQVGYGGGGPDGLIKKLEAAKSKAS
jgi:thioredoxin-related protein